MLAFDALVRGRVIFSAPEGAPDRVPEGHCRVEAHEGFVSLAWAEEDGTRSATLPAERFEEYLEAGAIVVLDASQLARTRTPVRP
jgi:hypothetical protein